jgi:predicted DCC family thiol-disulfide oxidoreductase YuxK
MPGPCECGPPDRPTVLYDDGCRFCRAMAELLMRLARQENLAVLPWSSPMAMGWMAGLTPEIRDASMHLKMPDGELSSGNAVFARTLIHVRGLGWLGRLSERWRFLALVLAAGYGWAARHRAFLSKLVPYRRAVERPPMVKQ